MPCDPELLAAVCLRQVKHGAHQGAGEQHVAARRRGSAHKEANGLMLDGKLLVQKEQVRDTCGASGSALQPGLISWLGLRRTGLDVGHAV